MTFYGFADLHNHQFAHLGFGGIEFFGEPAGALDQALPWCTPAHGPGGVADVIGEFLKLSRGGAGLGHKVGGWPQFDGWPRWDSQTHQTVHADWLERAWRGGLRLMVMLAVNNEWMCKLPGFTMAPGRTPADMEAVDLQLDAALAFEAQLDQQAGGPGKGWYRIVRTSQEAATVIAAGKLAVILGIEVDYVFNSYPSQPPTPEAVKAAVQAYYEKGVRYVFPIHFADNAFGGTALQNPMDGVDVGVQIPLPPIPPIFPGGTIETPYVLHTVDGKALGYQFKGGRRNSRGLTDLGRVLIEELIAHQMIFDVDHMSWQTRSDVLGIAERDKYPVLSGHSGFIDVVRGDKSNEGQQTATEVDRIRRAGGMVAPIIAQGNLDEVVTWTRPDGTSIPHVCGATTNTFVQPYLYAVERMNGGPVGIGTDFNGFAGVPGPISGPESCPGGNGDPNFHLRGLMYPFTAVVTGVQLDRSAVGQRTFDIDSDGLVHVGMLPDFIASLSMMGVRDNELEAVLTSANAFADTWSLANQSWQAAFQANTGTLWVVGHDDRGDMKLGMQAGTSPSIAALRGGGWECAFQASTGTLWIIGTADDRGDMKLGMQAGTSPSLTAVPGGWQCAFQANTGNLWVIGTADDRGDTGVRMMRGTSPSITQLRSGDWQAASHASTGTLWIVGHDDRGDMKLGMQAGTSPSIAALRGGGWECAFQASTGTLWIIGTADDRGDMKLGMQAGTSPSLVALPGGGWQCAFQANTGNLWVIGTQDDRGDTGLGMLDGTSPSMVAVPGGWQCTFQANQGDLWIVGTADDRGSLDLGMLRATNPSCTALSLPSA